MKKIAYMKQSFPKHKNNMWYQKARTIFEILVELNKKYQMLMIVVGSDRVKEFEKLTNQYNGVASRHGYYKFDNIQVVSAGERTQMQKSIRMSASKMSIRRSSK